jgi:CYTH domain-containing protein
VVAELELESPDAHFRIPPWVGEEVTGDPRYLVVNLAQDPFRRWSRG